MKVATQLEQQTRKQEEERKHAKEEQKHIEDEKEILWNKAEEERESHLKEKGEFMKQKKLHGKENCPIQLATGESCNVSWCCDIQLICLRRNSSNSHIDVFWNELDAKDDDQ